MTAWMDEAGQYLGQREVPGTGSNPWITKLWLALPGGAWFWKAYGNDDSKLPWCGAFLAYVFKALGIPHPAKFASAASWATWGSAVEHRQGAVMVYKRPGGNHVGLLVGYDSRGWHVVLGGNQDDGVTISRMNPGNCIASRWPPGQPVPEHLNLPLIAGALPVSLSQA